MVTQQVRALAEQRANAANEVTENVTRSRGRMVSASSAVDSGATRLKFVETLAEGVGEALARIEQAVAQVEGRRKCLPPQHCCKRHRFAHAG